MSYADTRKLAGELRTSADFIEAQGKGQFAVFMRGVTKSAISLTIPFGMMEAAPKLSPDEYNAMRQANRERYCVPKALPAPAQEPRHGGAQDRARNTAAGHASHIPGPTPAPPEDEPVITPPPSKPPAPWHQQPAAAVRGAMDAAREEEVPAPNRRRRRKKATTDETSGS